MSDREEFSREEVEKTVNAIDCVLGYDFEDAPVVARYALYLVKRAREEEWGITDSGLKEDIKVERQKVEKLEEELANEKKRFYDSIERIDGIELTKIVKLTDQVKDFRGALECAYSVISGNVMTKTNLIDALSTARTVFEKYPEGK